MILANESVYLIIWIIYLNFELLTGRFLCYFSKNYQYPGLRIKKKLFILVIIFIQMCQYENFQFGIINKRYFLHYLCERLINPLLIRSKLNRDNIFRYLKLDTNCITSKSLIVSFMSWEVSVQHLVVLSEY